MKVMINRLFESVVNGDAVVSKEAVQATLKAGVEPDRVLNQGLIAAMHEVGKRFERGEYFVPEMLVAARAMQTGMQVLRPYLFQKGVHPRGKVVIGTVSGDLHDIGKNLVALMLEGAGYEIHDLGVDVPPDVFVQSVRLEQPDLLALSALLTSTMQSMETTIQALQASGLRNRLKVMVGGAPLTNVFACQIGADGYAEDASRAVALAQSLTSL